MIVIADDITGAAEIAGIGVRYGMEVHFALDVLPIDIALRTGDDTLIVLTTDSRSATEAQAVEIHRIVAQDTLQAPHHRVYKKCDSVLRGHVLAELQVLRTLSAKPTAFLQPANPAAGRCISNGYYQIQGVPLHETAFARDPDFPATSDDVSHLLMRGNRPLPNSVTVVDCADISMLSYLASVIDTNALWAGSSAFFEQLLIHRYGRTAMAAIAVKPVRLPLLVVVGSQHSAFDEWLLRQQLKSPVITIPNEFIAQTPSAVNMDAFQQQIHQVLSQHNSLVVRLSTSGLPAGINAQGVLERVGKVMAPILGHFREGELWLTGGATAYAVLQMMGWTQLMPEEELLPGVVRMRVLGRPGLFVTVKPGSYPWPEGMLP